MTHVVVGILWREAQNGGREFLLVRSAKNFGAYTGLYYPPGGHVEAGEDERQALIRELREELGVEVTPVEELAETPGDVPGQLTHWWLCELPGQSLSWDRQELQDVRWFTADDIRESAKLWPATRQFFEAYIFPRRTF